MAEQKKPKEVGPEALTKVRVSFGMHFTFEAEGRESVVMQAYQRALEALVDVQPKEKS